MYRPKPSDRIVSAFVLVLAIVSLGIFAVMLGADGSGDLRNYHYYGGWALTNKAVGFDLAPGQLQTYHHPLLDAVCYRLLRWLNAYPLTFTFVWTIPQAVAVWMMFHVARLVLAPVSTVRDSLAVLAAVIGGSSAATLAVVGTSMSEGIPNTALWGAIWLVLSADRDCRIGGLMRAGAMMRRYAIAGLLAGTAAVLKLTMTPYVAGMVAAILALKLLESRLPRIRALAAFGGGGLVALAVLGGPWWLAVYRAFGNPLFPYYNAIFHSPYFPNENLFDRRFLPQTTRDWLIYPLNWAFQTSTKASETPVRDPRMLLELLAAIGLVLTAMGLRLGRAAETIERTAGLCWCAVFTLVAYGMWLKTFSILRYASALEMMSGIVTLGGLAWAVTRIAPSWRGPRVIVGIGLAATSIAILILPSWERRPHPGPRLISTDIERLSADSTVLLVSPQEGAFLAPFEPKTVRFIGLDNNLVNYSRKIGLEMLIAEAIDTAPGPLWSVSDPGPLSERAATSLAKFGLRRTDRCSIVNATIATPMALCRVERLPKS